MEKTKNEKPIFWACVCCGKICDKPKKIVVFVITKIKHTFAQNATRNKKLKIS